MTFTSDTQPDPALGTAIGKIFRRTEQSSADLRGDRP